MLESLRESAKGPVTRGILYLVIFAFIFGGGGMVFNTVVGDYVAKVNGDEITANELERSVEISKQRFGDFFDRLYDDETKIAGFRRNILNQLVQEKLLDQAIEDLGLRVSRAQVRAAVQNIPQFQKDGVYDRETAETLLRQVGYSESRFIAEQTKTIADQQFRQGILGSAFVLTNEVQFNYEMEHQERDIKFLTVEAKQFLEQAVVDDAAIETYYQENQTRFENPEKVKVDYVSLKLDDLKNKVEVDEAEAREKYDNERDSQYKKESRRKVAHILVAIDEEEGVTKDVARKKIEEVKALLTNGEKFADLAKKYSDDEASAESFGELDWFGRDENEASFEEAAYALEKVGDVSDVVETESGFHLIKLDGVEAEGYVGFDEVKSDIISELKNGMAQELFSEFKVVFDDKMLEIDDGLEEIATAIEAEIKTSAFLIRNGGGSDIFANPLVNKAAFSEDVLINDINSEAIKIDDWHYVVLRKKEYVEKTVRPLEQVKAQITQSLKKEFADNKAEEQGKALLTKLEAKEDVSDLLKTLNLEWKEEKSLKRTGSSINAQVRTAAFEAPKVTEGEQVFKGHKLSNGDYTVLEVLAIRAGDFSKAEDAAKQQIVDRLGRSNGQIDLALFIEWLKENSDITINL